MKGNQEHKLWVSCVLFLTDFMTDTLLNVFLAIAVDNLANAQELTKVCLWRRFGKKTKSLYPQTLKHEWMAYSMSLLMMCIFILPSPGWRRGRGVLQPEICQRKRWLDIWVSFSFPYYGENELMDDIEHWGVASSCTCATVSQISK